MKKASILVCIILIVSIVINSFLIYHGNYYNKFLSILGFRNNVNYVNWHLEAWKRSLQSIDYEAEIAFFGDSITYDGKWENYFKNKKIINLGLPGDTLKQAIDRVDMLSYTNPKKVFVMLGINTFKREKNITIVLNQYEELVEAILQTHVCTDIYIQSVLPVSKEKERDYVNNKSLAEFNDKLREIADVKGIHYIDLFSVFVEDGMMNDIYSYDGVHLTEEGYKLWVSILENKMESY